MAEGARLESVYTARYRGFESLPLRQIETQVMNLGFFIGVNNAEERDREG